MKAKPVKKITLALRPGTEPDFHNIVNNLIRWLVKRDKVLIFDKSEEQRVKSFASKKSIEHCLFLDDMFEDSDLIISLGGDGTLLGVLRKAPEKLATFGVNLGHLGFITEFSKTDFYESLNQVFLGELKTKAIPAYKVTHKRGNKLSSYHFINDFVISKRNLARMFTVSVDVDDEHLYDLRGDGLIVSSTVGSTAYSMAAGGPIVSDNVEAFILTPICPQGLNYRPLVLSDKSLIRVQLREDGENISITLDGQHEVEIEKRDSLVIGPGKRDVILIENEQYRFFQALKEKFNHA